MRSFGPKALLRAGQETVLQRQIRLVRSVWPSPDVVVVLGSQSERVRKTLPRGVRAVLNPEPETTSVTRSIGLGLEAATHPRALVLYGDLVFNTAAVEMFTRVSPDVSAVLVASCVGDYVKNAVGLCYAGRFAGHFSYGLSHTWQHMIYLAPGDKELFQAHALDYKNRKLLGHEILNKMVETGSKFLTVSSSAARVSKIDSGKDWETIKSGNETAFFL